MIATNDTSGRSSPSLRRFTPTTQSKTPLRNAANILSLCIGFTSQCIHMAFTPLWLRNADSLSAMTRVRATTRARSPREMREKISASKSSICAFVGLTITSGSNIPVGRVNSSTTPFPPPGNPPSSVWRRTFGEFIGIVARVRPLRTRIDVFVADRTFASFQWLSNSTLTLDPTVTRTLVTSCGMEGRARWYSRAPGVAETRRACGTLLQNSYS
mmetsp:Transcript_31289/g.50208  ORF Transcript_31289/g.50208 Transcript_31289/m.50208 type:complete len:214 (+) Transcript_31289:442-1083(+)